MSIEKAIKATVSMEPRNKAVINVLYTSRYLEGTADHFKNHELTMQQYNVLRILRGQKGKPANVMTVQERMIDRSSNTTRLIDKLVKKELVKRQVCQQNRRKIELFITPNGMELLATLDPIIEAHNKLVTQRLSEKELETLNSLLDKMRNNDEPLNN
ncbi:MarR family winged helix-turn-helix transcriptional regulator [Altibacter sp. HG106]|uniref:MarR family winged helix-turn-helix transcriptional regulator n=1 Tax=Altibacter sp. HG106 TaxID=3023937 RepID=UPI00234FC381|nr:MarR family transcriptional regulator [Altibacter sp. HG106]MDC7996157.1 MarR family transcriptional regulator [Altibacter sp. HG106]